MAAALLLTMIAGLPRIRSEQRAGVDVPAATATRGQIILEVRVAAGGASDRFDGGGGQRGAAAVGVRNDAGGVDDGAQRGPTPGRQPRAGARQGFGGDVPRRRVVSDPGAGDLGAELVEGGARFLAHQRVRRAFAAQTAQQLVHRRQRAKQGGLG